MAQAEEGPSLKRSLRSIAALSGSALLLQALSLLSAPLLARLYKPEHFGVLATINALAAPVTLLSTFQFPAAIVIAPDEQDAEALIATTLRTSLAVSVTLAVVGWLASGRLSTWLHIDTATSTLLAVAIGVSVLINGTSAVVSAAVNRKQRYQVLASARLVAGVASLAVNVIIGFAYPGWWGLFAGYVVGNAAVLVSCGWAARGSLRGALASSARTAGRAAFSRFRRYPLYVLPSEILNSFLAQAPVYALTAFSGVSATGRYGLGQRMLGLPLTLVGSSVAEVFTRQAALRYAEEGECRELFRRTAAMLAIVAVPAFGLIALLGPDAFSLVFGDRWRAAGEYVRLLAPMMALRFVASPVSAMYVVAERQREDLGVHWLFGMIMAASLIAAGHWQASSHAIVGICSGISTLFYATYLVRSWQFAKGQGLCAADPTTTEIAEPPPNR